MRWGSEKGKPQGGMVMPKFNYYLEFGIEITARNEKEALEKAKNFDLKDFECTREEIEKAS